MTRKEEIENLEAEIAELQEKLSKLQQGDDYRKGTIIVEKRYLSTGYISSYAQQRAFFFVKLDSEEWAKVYWCNPTISFKLFPSLQEAQRGCEHLKWEAVVE
jgi:hypothetical protein